MGLDCDENGFPDDRMAWRLTAEMSVRSQSAIERIAGGWDREVGQESARFALTRDVDALVFGAAEHGEVCVKAQGAADNAALGFLAGGLIGSDQTETLPGPVADPILWPLREVAA